MEQLQVTFLTPRHVECISYVATKASDVLFHPTGKGGLLMGF